MKTILFLLVFISIAYAQQSPNSPGDNQNYRLNNTEFVGKTYNAQIDSIAPDSSGMTSLTSVELTQKLIPGWNLGNTLEALPNETAWGNPLTSLKLMDSVKAAGFNSVRIPVAWFRTTDTSVYTIDPIWLDRVEEVVNLALNADLYLIINEHWDNGWQIPTYEDSAYVNRRLAAMWEQIAVQLRDYDSHLIFAGTNEIHVPDDWGTPSRENYTVQNGYNQTFVNTVRSTGGRNYYRYLAVQGYNTNIDNTVRFFEAPVDPVENRLIVEVHYYDPYNFTLNSDDKITQWGMYATDPSKTETWANEPWADAQFKKMKTHFVDKGFGVILGEYGATIRTNLGTPELNEEYEKYRVYYTQYVTRSMVRNGIVPYYWDIGHYGNHGSGVFDRNSGKQVYPAIIDAVVDTSKVDPVTSMRESSLNPNGFYLRQNYPNPFNPYTMITYQLPNDSFVTLKVFDSIGREVKTLANELQSAGNRMVKFDGTDLPSGVYFYTLRTESFTDTRKLLLLR